MQALNVIFFLLIMSLLYLLALLANNARKSNDRIVNFLNSEKSSINRDLLKERTKSRPDKAKERSLAMALQIIGELQNRILDNFWKR